MGVPTYIVTGVPMYIVTGVPMYIVTGVPMYIVTGVPTYIVTGVPMYIVTGVPMYIVTGVPMYIVTGVPMYIVTGVPMYIVTGVPTYIVTGVPMYIVTGVPTYIVTGVPTYIVTGVPTYIVTGVPMYIVTGVPMYIVTGVPMYIVTGVPTYIVKGVPTYIVTGVPTYIVTGVPIYIVTGVPMYIVTGVPMYIVTGVPMYIVTGVPMYIVTGMPTYIVTGVPTYIVKGVPTYIVTGVPMCIVTGVPMYIVTGVPTYIVTGVPTYIVTGVPMYIVTGVPMYIVTGVPMYIVTGVPMYIVTGVPMYIVTGVPMYIVTGVPMYIVTGVPMYIVRFVFLGALVGLDVPFHGGEDDGEEFDMGDSQEDDGQEFDMGDRTAARSLTWGTGQPVGLDMAFHSGEDEGEEFDMEDSQYGGRCFLSGRSMHHRMPSVLETIVGLDVAFHGGEDEGEEFDMEDSQYGGRRFLTGRSMHHRMPGVLETIVRMLNPKRWGRPGGPVEAFGQKRDVWHRALDNTPYGQFSLAMYEANYVMEDTAEVEGSSSGVYIGVHDGHGGTETSEFLKENLYFNLKAQFMHQGGQVSAEAVRGAFHETETAFTQVVRQSFEASPHLATVGSCSVVAVVTGNALWVANVGDCRAVLGQVRKGDDNSLECRALQLSVDHNLSFASIREKFIEEHADMPDAVVEKRGGFRVKGKVTVTRSFGDLYLKSHEFNREPLFSRFRVPEPFHPPLLSCEPNIAVRLLSPHDSFVILASDGLFEFISNQEAVDIVASSPRKDIARQLIRAALRRAAERREIRYQDLLRMASGQRREYHDDITVVVFFFNHEARTKHAAKSNMTWNHVSERGREVREGGEDGGQRREYHDDITVVVFFFNHEARTKHNKSNLTWNYDISFKAGKGASLCCPSCASPYHPSSPLHVTTCPPCLLHPYPQDISFKGGKDARLALNAAAAADLTSPSKQGANDARAGLSSASGSLNRTTSSVPEDGVLEMELPAPARTNSRTFLTWSQ
ncbi:unnamed protein product [Closterium sp. NIES-65]|nr:unnamed protein product [Closterium sp. NIES-65]